MCNESEGEKGCQQTAKKILGKGKKLVRSGRRKLKLAHWKIVGAGLLIYDAIMAAASYFLALWLRFDCHFTQIPRQYWDSYETFIPIYVVLCVAVFWLFRLYKSIWRFASFNELIYVSGATVVTSAIHIIGISMVMRMPISYYCFGMFFQFIFTLGIRFSYRFVLLLRNRNQSKGRKHPVMLVGAGAAGRMILRDMLKSPESPDEVVCVIDDNRNKWGRYIEGVKVVGDRDDILSNVKKYQIDKIYIALPSATAEQKRDLLTICNETGCELRQVPDLYQLVKGQATVRDMKKVSVEDLLGREPIKADMKEVFHFIKGKSILVTGGGGSIGSEICRQVAAHHPKQLIIFDIYENNAYQIQLELREKFPDLNLVTLIGSVRDSRRLEQVFAQYHPEIVYHAAAHKHVPLMEDSPCEAIKNNTIGTYKTAYAAMMHGCQKFVLISTDKAVNPTNIMGASKRLCEMVIQSFNTKIKEGKVGELPALHTHTADQFEELKWVRSLPKNVKTEFVAVRFGNVLGSNGSVIPIFNHQIQMGGPVTVTHPDIIRYFMTIPEAVSLVLQAGTFAKGGEIYVLDMGSPVKIDTLARNLIKLSGYRPDVDIKIEYTGLRPGEKLYEEKLMEEEGLKTTTNQMIHIGCPIPFKTDEFLEDLEELMVVAYYNDEEIKSLVAEMVNTYHPEESQEMERRSEAYIRLVQKVALGL